MVRALWFIHQPDRVTQNVSNVLSADWQHQNIWKNNIFFTCVVTAFLRTGNPCVTLQFTCLDKVNFYITFISELLQGFNETIKLLFLYMKPKKKWLNTVYIFCRKTQQLELKMKTREVVILCVIEEKLFF